MSAGAPPPSPSPASNPQVVELLALSALTLATAGPDGQPHAAPVYFVAGESLRLYFFSAADSRHSTDVARDPRAAAALYPECRTWREIRGLQLHGAVHPVEPGPEWDGAWERYAAKFPFVSALRDEVARSRLYVFVPRWVRLVDNRQGFGFKQEWTLE